MTQTTWSPVEKSSRLTLYNENMGVKHTDSSFNAGVITTEGKSEGSWYWEFGIIEIGSFTRVGVASGDVNLEIGNNFPDRSGEEAVYESDGRYWDFGGGNTPHGSSWTNGDVVGVAFSIENKTLEFYVNGVGQGVLNVDLGNKIYYPFMSSYLGGDVSLNLGQEEFKYDIPEGFVPYIGLSGEVKHLIKNNNKIHILTQNGELIYPIIGEHLNQKDYEDWGMDDLDGYEQNISKVKYEVAQSEQTETGSVYRYEIDKTGLGIKSVTIE